MGSLRDALYVWAAGEFPRHVRSTSDWSIVRGFDEFYGFAAGMIGSGEPAHASVYPAVEESELWFNTFLIEIDGRDAVDSQSAMRRIYRVLAGDFYASPRVYYSGNRSFHVYVDLMPVQGRAGLDALSALAGQVAKRAGVPAEVIDFNMYQPKHLIRVPFSVNEKSGRHAVAVRPEWSLDEIFELSRGPNVAVDYANSPSEAITRAVAQALPKRAEAREPRRSGSRIGWIEELLERGVEDGRHRLAIYVITPYLARRCGSFDEALAVARRWLSLQRNTSLSEGELRYYLQRAFKGVEGKRSIRFWRTIEEIPDPQLREIVLKGLSEKGQAGRRAEDEGDRGRASKA